MRQRFTTAKTATKAVIISGAVLFTATAAAAGGVLPHAAQSAVSRVVEHVGIHVENPDKSAQAAEDATSTSSSIDDSSTSSSADDSQHSSSTEANDDSSASGSDDSVGPDASGSAHDGLCHAFLEHQSNPSKAEDSVAMKNLAAAAAKAGQTVEVFCATTASSIDDHGNATGSDDATNTSSSLPGSSGRNGSKSGVDDTTHTSVPTVSVPAAGNPTVTPSSVDDKGGANKGGSKP